MDVGLFSCRFKPITIALTNIILPAIKFIGKKEIAALTDKRLKKYEIVKKESNWRVYSSSNSFVKYKIDKGYTYEKHILGVAFSKKHLTYLEAESLFYFKALENKDCLNDNILGKFFKSDYEQWLSQVQK